MIEQLTDHRMSRRGWVLFALLSVVWGVPYLMIRIAVAEVSVPFLVFARSAVGAAVLFPIALGDRGFAQIRRHWIPVAAFALVEMIVPWGLLAHAEIRLNSSTAGLLIATTPIITVMFGKLSSGTEPLGRLRRTGLTLGFVGVSVLAAPHLGGDLRSITETVVAAACYAAGSIVAARWLKSVPATALTLTCLAIASGVYLLPALITWPHSVPSLPVIASIVGLGGLCTALAFALFFLLIREVGAERAVVITYVAPVVAVAAGVTILSEPLNVRIAFSFVLILCGSYLATDRSAPTVQPGGWPQMYYASIGELSSRIRERTVSPVEAVEACLKRIETLNPTLNAFITVMADEARAEARAADAEIKAGHWRGPLHGVPVAVKDFYDTAGVTTTGGFEPFKDRVPDKDAEAVKRLRRAGAIVIGKTNMDALGMATTGLTSHFGPVRNPWNRVYVTGGSSAGSAAAVAAGLCFATVDTDAVGSVRLPAACCGVVGFKGSSDLISTRGILGDQPVDDFVRWMAHAAVTTRSAADTALVLNVLTDRANDFAAALARADTQVRIGVGNNFTADAEVKQAFDKAVIVLREAGYETHASAVPFGDSSQGSMATIEADREGIAAEAFSDVDVIVLPTLDSTVPTVAAAATNPEQGVSAETTAFANYYSLPVASVPCGFDSHDMPIGLQIVGRPRDERTVLNVAHHYELAAKVNSRHPIA